MGLNDMSKKSYCQGKLAYGRIIRPMDIAILNSSTLKIKTKSGILLVDPSDTKSEADVAVFLEKSPAAFKGVRLNIVGPGEFEASSIKVTSIRLEDSFFHVVDSDGLRLGIGKMSSIEKFPERLGDFDVAIINVDTLLNKVPLGTLEVKLVILYSKTAENLKGADEDGQSVSKISITSDKLGPELKTVVLK
jgi:hypothetical protein